jgi:hypothetical protein
MRVKKLECTLRRGTDLEGRGDVTLPVTLPALSDLVDANIDELG